MGGGFALGLASICALVWLRAYAEGRDLPACDDAIHGRTGWGIFAGDGAAYPVRGGDWLVPGGELQRVERASAATNLVTPEIGSRCVRKATPV